jgi:hypothetical protein
MSNRNSAQVYSLYNAIDRSKYFRSRAFEPVVVSLEKRDRREQENL